ncbi:hypothetical protein BT63DRAFT_421135 [Microthyrium microscopicum]|uniref:Cytochrome b561 domain-containing protein n=1 Tax=Microthyrium microscopicum TaxID=703497 RepID=A0A6A6UL02_9PEZI|nr:hypothetical protein BT63DRAFT_421135 [Microthyrium microscopicum]
MSNSPSISAPGSSTYNSKTLHVGDGTWDSARDDFLLPNLQGLNFATMQYNGMGNRFQDLPEYHKLVKGHGVLAAITFLGIVPAAIFIARFYWREPRWALRMHIWLQILTVFLSTVVLVLGWFAVGPSRSLTNPHHGIGVAIYVLIMFQAIWGWLVRKLDKGRVVWKVSVKLMLHQWVGRATALLAVAQVPLGLTLYGSPKVLFILYALWMFLLVTLYFFFSHRYQAGGGGDDGSMSYYTDGTRTDITTDRRNRRSSGGHGFLKAAAAGGLAATALGLFRKQKHDKEETVTSVSDNRPHGHGRQSRSSSYTGSSYDEKVEHGAKEHTWRNRILAGAGAAAAFGLAKNMFSRKKKTEEASQVSDYTSHSGYTGSRTDVSRMEEGRVPVTPSRTRIRHSEEDLSTIGPGVPAAAALGGSPSRHGRNRLRKSGGSILSEETAESYYSPGKEKIKRRNEEVGGTIAALGLAGYLKHKFGQRKDRREEERIERIKEEDRVQEERIQRRNSNRRFTGDGRPSGGRHNSFTESEVTPVTGSTPALSRHHMSRPGAGAGAVTAAAAAAEVLHGHNSHSQSRLHQGSRITVVDEESNLSHLPPPPIIGALNDSSGSEAYTSPGGSRRTRHHQASASYPPPPPLGGGRGAGVSSPPLSIKMKMRNDNGRQHVTLRRLSPAEAAAEREAARRARPGRAESVSSLGGGSGDERWRRTEARERIQDEEMRASRQSLGTHPSAMGGGSYADMPLPPPPPIPGAGSAMYSGDSTAAGSARADSNRRRRRAERAREAAAGRSGNKVEFT